MNISTKIINLNPNITLITVAYDKYYGLLIIKCTWVKKKVPTVVEYILIKLEPQSHFYFFFFNLKTNWSSNNDPSDPRKSSLRHFIIFYLVVIKILNSLLRGIVINNGYFSANKKIFY